MIDNFEEKTCPYCGAPVKSEICPYCGNQTDVETEDIALEYPQADIKSCDLSFFTAVFPLIFAFSFGFFGFVFPFIFFYSGEDDILPFLVSSPFALISIAAFVVEFKFVIPYIFVKLKGTAVRGTVYGYMFSNTLYNGNPGQIAKILIDTKYGKRFIMYDTHNTTKPFPVNEYVDVFIYKDHCIVKKPKIYLYE